ncbi:MAG: hypothetical protein MUF49_23910 [Oculatellaceae cyanobacterium Prado106]|nr:hypothetical protein [Oculatellaceae cyanobacterium Prado106]
MALKSAYPDYTPSRDDRERDRGDGSTGLAAIFITRDIAVSTTTGAE